jgi:hypothetical protein
VRSRSPAAPASCAKIPAFAQRISAKTSKPSARRGATKRAGNIMSTRHFVAISRLRLRATSLAPARDACFFEGVQCGPSLSHARDRASLERARAAGALCCDWRSRRWSYFRLRHPRSRVLAFIRRATARRSRPRSTRRSQWLGSTRARESPCALRPRRGLFRCHRRALATWLPPVEARSRPPAPFCASSAPVENIRTNFAAFHA